MKLIEWRPARQGALPEDNPTLQEEVAAIRLLYRAMPPGELQTSIIASLDRALAPSMAGKAVEFTYRQSLKRQGGPRLRWATGGLVLAAMALGASALPLAPAATRGNQAARTTPWERAWSMVGHDPQQTGRSPGVGPLRPKLLWTYRGMFDRVIVGPDVNVYGWTDKGLVALSATGRPRWTVKMNVGFGGPPVLGADGIVRVSAEIGGGATLTMGEPHVAFLGISRQGKRLWTIDTLPWASVPHSAPFSKGVAPIVTAANVLYVPLVGPAYGHLENNGVEMVDAQGKPLRRLLKGYGGPIALALNGTVYQLGYNYASQTYLTAGRSDGAVLWQQLLPYEQSGTVIVGGNRTIYVSDGSGWGTGDMGDTAAYTPEGKLLWHRSTSGVATLAERADGSILLADRGGLSAVSARGVRLWHASLGRIATKDQASFSLAVDASGQAFVGTADGKARAFSANGTPLWTLAAGGPALYGRGSTVALGPNGVLAVVGTDDRLRFYQ